MILGDEGNKYIDMRRRREGDIDTKRSGEGYTDTRRWKGEIDVWRERIERGVYTD